MTNTIKLRVYQHRASNHIVGEVLDDSSVIALISPTASGKSIIVLSALSRLTNKTYKIVCVPQSHIKSSFYFKGKLESPEYKTHIDLHPETIPVWKDSSSGKEEITRFLELPQPGGFLLTTHQSMVKIREKELPLDCSSVILFIDEAHHISDVSTKRKGATKLTDVVSMVNQRGGTIVYVTATPIRGDGAEVLPSGVIPWVRSIADQCEEGFSPQNIRHEIATLKGYKATSINHVLGESIPKKTSGAEAQLYNQWIKDGKPKTVIIIPAKNCDEWRKRILDCFVKKGVRIFDAVGEKKQKDLLTCLKEEKNIRSYKESQVDVILACKRFDEGTDWPLCSHVYQIGISKSLRPVIQRLGRTLRSKYKEEEKKPRWFGMPKEHLNTGSITFFLPEGQTSDIRKELWKSHRDYLVLLACFLHDYQTGQKYISISNNLWKSFDKRSSRGGKKDYRKTVEKISNLISLEDSRKAEIKSILFRMKLKVGEKLEDIVKEIENRECDSLEKTHLLIMAFQDIPNEKVSEALGKRLVKRLNLLTKKKQVQNQAKNPLSGIILEELLNEFSEVSKNYNNIMLSSPEEILSSIGRFTGLEAKEITETFKRSFNSNKALTVLDQEICIYRKENNGNFPIVEGKWKTWSNWIRENTEYNSLPNYLDTNYEDYELHRKQSFEEENLFFSNGYSQGETVPNLVIEGETRFGIKRSENFVWILLQRRGLTKPVNKKVVVTILETGEEIEYSSITEAHKKLNISIKALRRGLKTKTPILKVETPIKIRLRENV